MTCDLEWREIGIGRTNPVGVLHLFPNQAIGPAENGRRDVAPLYVGLAPRLLVDKALQEKSRHQGRHYFYPLSCQPIRHVLLGKRIELQENLAHHAYLGEVLPRRDFVKNLGRLRQ